MAKKIVQNESTPLLNPKRRSRRFAVHGTPWKGAAGLVACNASASETDEDSYFSDNKE
jgi:hypothetical protein